MQYSKWKFRLGGTLLKSETEIYVTKMENDK
jgi:hypothetical protein